MKRIIYYDAIKCLAIFTMCFYHGNMLEKNILENPSVVTYFYYFLQCFLSVCVPLFFMVNGALILNAKFDNKKNIRKIIKLIILLFAWSLILLLILKYILHDTYTIKSLFVSIWFLKAHRISHLWFLQALIAVYLFGMNPQNCTDHAIVIRVF
jgi:surface polysaccharide O-acyltransferase-like enzyme